MRLSHTLARMSVAFDDPNLVSAAGLVPVEGAPLAIADYGVSEGRNSMAPIGAAKLEKVLRRFLRDQG